jgi:hypothetical protein
MQSLSVPKAEQSARGTGRDARGAEQFASRTERQASKAERSACGAELEVLRTEQSMRDTGATRWLRRERSLDRHLSVKCGRQSDLPAA